MRLLQRFRLKHHILEGDVLTLETRRIARPQFDDCREIFVGHASALMERHTEDVEFLLVPADPNVTMMRPLLIQSAVDNTFAMTMGCCSGSSVTLEFTAMRCVAPAKKACA